MPTYVALLRGINVSGQKSLAMKDLRRLVEALPADEVRTYLQSGNVVFHSDVDDASSVASSCRDAVDATLGLSVEVLVRTPEELDGVLDRLPFSSESMVYVTFLASSPDPAKVTALANADVAASGGDVFHLSGREIYVSCPDGYGRTKLNNAMFERKLGVAATTRNWRTVSALAQMAHR